MRIHFFFHILIASLMLLPNILFSQGCIDVNEHILCADSPPLTTSLESNPFSYACFNAPNTYFYSFHTGTAENAQVFIDIQPIDCDDFNGNNNLSLIVFEIASGADPCNPVNYKNPSNCFSDNEAFSAALSGLSPDTDYILVVGSDHSLSNYGECIFDAAIHGPGVDVTASVYPILISLGQSAVLSASGSTGGYQWSPAHTLSNSHTSTTTATPDATTNYVVSSTIGTCKVTDQVTVTVGPPIVVYNAFTPNGDGINDTWSIKGIQKFENALINVYDRWGQNVFRSLGYGKPWDGTNKGGYLPTAAYYYVIELNSPDVSIPPITGVVSIIN